MIMHYRLNPFNKTFERKFSFTLIFWLNNTLQIFRLYLARVHKHLISNQQINPWKSNNFFIYTQFHFPKTSCKLVQSTTIVQVNKKIILYKVCNWKEEKKKKKKVYRLIVREKNEIQFVNINYKRKKLYTNKKYHIVQCSLFS